MCPETLKPANRYDEAFRENLWPADKLPSDGDSDSGVWVLVTDLK